MRVGDGNVKMRALFADIGRQGWRHCPRLVPIWGFLGCCVARKRMGCWRGAHGIGCMQQLSVCAHPTSACLGFLPRRNSSVDFLHRHRFGEDYPCLEEACFGFCFSAECRAGSKTGSLARNIEQQRSGRRVRTREMSHCPPAWMEMDALCRNRPALKPTLRAPQAA